MHILADPDNLHPTNGSSQIRDEVLQYLHGALINTIPLYRTLAIQSQPGNCICDCIARVR